MKVKNLFGEMQELDEKIDNPVNQSSYQTHKKNVNYRLGTSVECCKTCEHLLRVSGGSKTYNKCALIGDSRSTATDIRLRDVCDLWERELNG